MKFILTEQSWILDDLDPVEWTFLDRIPEMATGEDDSSQNLRHLLPKPLEAPVAEREELGSFLEDWEEYVRPDLESSFSAARDQVSRDLAMASVQAPPIEPDPDRPSDEDVAFADEFVARNEATPLRVEVARDASDAWYSALNQARLLMNANHDLAEMTERFRWPKDDEIGAEPFDGTLVLLLAQYEFYTGPAEHPDRSDASLRV